MSSTGQSERFKIGARVEASDGHVGRLTRVIVDPVAQTLTHLVVEPRHHEALSRLVPVDLVDAVEDDGIRLGCTRARFDRLDSAEDFQFLPPSADALGYGGDGLAWPYYGLGMPLAEPGSGRGHPMYSDRVPLGEVELRRGDQVHAIDGWIGAIHGLVIDPSDHHVTHVLLQEGHLLRRKQVAIPIGKASRVGEETRIDLTKEQVEELPPVTLSSAP